MEIVGKLSANPVILDIINFFFNFDKLHKLKSSGGLKTFKNHLWIVVALGRISRWRDIHNWNNWCVEVCWSVHNSFLLWILQITSREIYRHEEAPKKKVSIINSYSLTRVLNWHHESRRESNSYRGLPISEAI